ncbi:MAG TPA: nuclear transport factor 2 family protein [Burkholderiales bacterium]|nr:nuclear transport factor 2 family protein [Burkholderiales bacterium]
MDKIKQTIRELESRRFRAMIEADAVALEALLADSMIYTHSSATTDGKASYIAGVKSKKWQYRQIDRPIEDIQVHGDTVVVTGQVRIDILIDGKPKIMNSRYTDVWVKGAKGWQMVA